MDDRNGPDWDGVRDCSAGFTCKAPACHCGTKRKRGRVVYDKEIGEFVRQQTRTFETGATRDTAEGKPSYARMQSPLVVRRFGEYMLEHTRMPDGSSRDQDNWKQGIPLDVYFESADRHFHDLWLHHQGYGSLARHGLEATLCALRFNLDGYLHVVLAEKA